MWNPFSFWDANDVFRKVFSTDPFLGSPSTTDVALFNRPLLSPSMPMFSKSIFPSFEEPMKNESDFKLVESKSVKTTTEIKNGQKLTKTETTTIDKEGRETREEKEEKFDLRNRDVLM